MCRSSAVVRDWHQGCQFGFFEAKFVIFGLFSTLLAFFMFEKRPDEIWLFLAFFGELDFLYRFGGFLDTGRFLNTVSGHRKINFDWKLCTRICNFLFCLFHAFRFALSGCSSAKPKVSRSLQMERASILKKRYVYIVFQKRVWVF